MDLPDLPDGASLSKASAPTSPSSFRNVSACYRCRTRKNRCDQNLPACSACEKAGERCVGFDPSTKREIPRSYLYYLESRIRYLEALLRDGSIEFEPASTFDLDAGRARVEDTSESKDASIAEEDEKITERSEDLPESGGRASKAISKAKLPGQHRSSKLLKRERLINDGQDMQGHSRADDDSEDLDQLVTDIGLVSVQGASDSRYLGSTSGISFARVVADAIKHATPDQSARSGYRSRPSTTMTPAATILPGAKDPPSTKDPIDRLKSRTAFKPAQFPDRKLGLRLVELYFDHANPQTPILHRGEFMSMFARAYQTKSRQRSAKELYFLNIVFAIGAGIIFEAPAGQDSSPGPDESTTINEEPIESQSKGSHSSDSPQQQPEEYYASAMLHRKAFGGVAQDEHATDGHGGALEQLQAVLLLASFALLRPVAPGLWSITGDAVRLGVELGLHHEEPNMSQDGPRVSTSEQRGQQEWIRDLRRRLWWCVYSFDRLVSTCVGRPFGITDQVITTRWPSLVDDKDITPAGFLKPDHNFREPSYKHVSHHYFRLRLLQSEISQVLQYRQAQRVHRGNHGSNNPHMHTDLCSSFLQPFGGSFKAWRGDVDRRLREWKDNAPSQQKTLVRFDVRFLELNYWQAIILLYRQTLSIPVPLTDERGPHDKPDTFGISDDEDHEEVEKVCLRIAEAGHQILVLYKELHKAHLVNYTYLATIHLFMAGIVFLYSLWRSETVRARMVCFFLSLTIDLTDDEIFQTTRDVKCTMLAGTSVLADLAKKCPPAKACQDAFDRMSNATIIMCQNTPSFGFQVKSEHRNYVEESKAFLNLKPPGMQTSGRYPSHEDLSQAQPPSKINHELSDLLPKHWQSIPEQKSHDMRSDLFGGFDTSHTEEQTQGGASDRQSYSTSTMEPHMMMAAYTTGSHPAPMPNIPVATATFQQKPIHDSEDMLNAYVTPDIMAFSSDDSDLNFGFIPSYISPNPQQDPDIAAIPFFNEPPKQQYQWTQDNGPFDQESYMTSNPQRTDFIWPDDTPGMQDLFFQGPRADTDYRMDGNMQLNFDEDDLMR